MPNKIDGLFGAPPQVIKGPIGWNIVNPDEDVGVVSRPSGISGIENSPLALA